MAGRENQRSLEKYHYQVEACSPEGFTELMHTRGIDVHPKGAADSRRTFTSERLLDMRGLKQRGIIKSYKIMKVVITEEVIEEDG
jgi:hypothetical protein